MKDMQHIDTIPWPRRWLHRIRCFFALRKTRRMIGVGQQNLCAPGVHNTPHPATCACWECRASRCQHRSVTRLDDLCFCDECGAQLDFDRQTRNWARLNPLLPRPIETDDFSFVALLPLAQMVVESSLLFRKFIDGTPLENDMAVHMALFAQDAVARYIQGLPADWHKDASLETWFPLTAERIMDREAMIAEQKNLLAKATEAYLDETAELRRQIEAAIPILKLAYARGHYCDQQPCPGCEAGYALEKITGRKWTQEECESAADKKSATQPPEQGVQ